MTKICLFEDNTKLGGLTQRALQRYGYFCDWFVSYDEREQREQKASYHVFLIDIMLPGIDGMQIAERIRSHSDAGIIFLTARSGLEDKEEGFTVGCDDYITKPFSTKELCLRIDALLRRLEKSQCFQIGDVFVDQINRSVVRDGHALHLTPTEWEVLLFLAARRPGVALRADVIEAVWGTDHMFEMKRSLDVAIVNLRKKLGKERIVTVIGVGYQLQ